MNKRLKESPNKLIRSWGFQLPNKKAHLTPLQDRLQMPADFFKFFQQPPICTKKNRANFSTMSTPTWKWAGKSLLTLLLDLAEQNTRSLLTMPAFTGLKTG